MCNKFNIINTVQNAESNVCNTMCNNVVQCSCAILLRKQYDQYCVPKLHILHLLHILGNRSNIGTYCTKSILERLGSQMDTQYWNDLVCRWTVIDSESSNYLKSGSTANTVTPSH